MSYQNNSRSFPISLRVVVTLSSLPLFCIGIGAMFVPSRMMDLVELAPRGTYGYNTIRSDIGGLLISSGMLILIGLWRREGTWFLAVTVVMSLLLVGRFVSFAIDGFTIAALPALVIEVVVIVAMLAAYRYSDKSAADTAGKLGSTS